MMYVSLRNTQDSVIFHHKLTLADGTAYGHFFIPTSLQTGVYKLLSYTNHSLNNVHNTVTQINLFIINPFVRPDLDSEFEEVISVIPKLAEAAGTPETRNHSTAHGILLAADKSSYKFRDKITLKIENAAKDSGPGNYTLSVRRVDPIQVLDSMGSLRNFELATTGLYRLPELRGELISGRVIDTDGARPAPNMAIAFSIPGSDYIFKIAKTNDHGQFFISIDQPYNATSSIFQVIGDDREQYQIALDEKKITNASKHKSAILRLDPAIKSWLQERSIQIQIQNAYFKEEKTKASQGKPAAPFYGDLGAEFLLDDYTRFPTLKETFVEIIRWARLRKKEGKEIFEVFDPQDPYKVGPYSTLSPLVLVDGIFIHQANEVLRISANDVKSIHVVSEPYRIGPSIFQGIIDIQTKKGSFRPQLTGDYLKELSLENPLVSRQFLSPDYSDETLQRIPDYRVQLFWKPQIRIISAEHTESFYASDVPGTYQVVLEGFAANGDHILVKEYFVVE
jgi:hypothetical protein